MKQADLYRTRLDRLRRAMKRDRLDAFLVWDRANTRYLTGFAGSASVTCLMAGRGWFLTDFRYFTIAKSSVAHLQIVQSKPPEGEQVAAILNRHRAKRVGFEDSLPYRLYKAWRETLGDIELVEATALIRRLRECKTQQEIGRIVRAQRIAEKVLDRILTRCRPGITERHLAREIVHAIEDQGGDGPSFDPIVASGSNAALPHARPGDRVLRKGDLVILDLGVCKDGYGSDMTRTVVLGRASDRQKQVYETVLQAQRRAIARVRGGIAARAVDRAARRWIENKGFGKQFGHGTGHGVGLEVHESPALNPQSQDTLRPGMVLTIEPGIYIPGWGGVRIEDMVVVRAGGREVISRYPRDLHECPSDQKTKSL